jgi:spore germination cell wall hydrolase CwlJ-like protein
MFGEVLYCKSSIIAALMTLIFSTSAHAQAPRSVQNLTKSAAITKVEEAKREEVTCLALAIYFEARGESARGQINRTRSKKYPSTACGVLFQKGQFSFIRRGSHPTPKTSALWDNAITMAASIMQGSVSDVSNGALSFCQRRLRKSGFVIGNHVFY